MKQNKRRKTNINTKKAYRLEYVLKWFSSHQLLIVMSNICFLKQTTKTKTESQPWILIQKISSDTYIVHWVKWLHSTVINHISVTKFQSLSSWNFYTSWMLERSKTRLWAFVKIPILMNNLKFIEPFENRIFL